MDSFNYDSLLVKAFKELYSEYIGKSAFSHFSHSEIEYLGEKHSFAGHKLLGYPCFTMEDPRDEETTYDTLLFQMDSGDGIMWGDCGVANFFINEKK